MIKIYTVTLLLSLVWLGAEALQSTDTSTVLDEESLDLWGEEFDYEDNEAALEIRSDTGEDEHASQSNNATPKKQLPHCFLLRCRYCVYRNCDSKDQKCLDDCLKKFGSAIGIKYGAKLEPFVNVVMGQCILICQKFRVKTQCMNQCQKKYAKWMREIKWIHVQ